MTPTTIFVADDHPLILEGLASLIQGIEQFRLVGRALNGKEVVSYFSSVDTLPDLCILDLEMPEMDGITTLKFLKEKFPTVKVLILTVHEEPFYVNRVIKAGANGYLLKNLNRDAFIQQITRIMQGESFFPDGSSVRIKPEAGQSLDILTDREKHILRLIALGKSTKEIAAELFISKRTVDTHRNNLKRKLRVTSIIHLVHYSYANGLV